MSKVITAYPRTPGMTDEEWSGFRSFNHRRRKEGEEEWTFDAWFAANQAKWPSRQKQPNRERPEGADPEKWENYIGFRSYRRGKGMYIPSFEEYVEFYATDADAKLGKAQKVVARILKKASASLGTAKPLSPHVAGVVEKINRKALEQAKKERDHGNP